MTWRPDLNSSHREIAKIAHLTVPYTRGMGVDVGSGDFRAFQNWITLDNGMDFGGKRVADIHAAGDGILPFSDSSLDFVVSSHYLEHVVDFRLTLAEWWRVIRKGGHLVLYLPHADLYPRMGQPGSNPDHKHDFLPEDIIDAMSSASMLGGWDLIENETREGGDEYSFFQVYRKRDDFETNQIPWQRNPGGKKRLLVARFGAYGDMLQTASILPALKAQGWHITMMTAPRGEEVVRHDPHIDEFMLQDEQQIQTAALGIHVNRVAAERFDRTIHLTTATEQTLLLHPSQIPYTYDHGARHRLFDQNYLERIFACADLDYDPAGDHHRFYPTKDESAAADRFAKRHDGKLIVMVALAGSAVHKVYPHIAAVVRFILQNSDAHVILVGGKDAAPLEQIIGAQVLDMEDTGLDPMAYELAINKHYGADRVSFRSGIMSIRQSLSYAQRCDFVIGPETGVLNAVAHHRSVRKIVLLSHSSNSNLTRDWPNTIALEPVSTACYPCHRLHYGWEHCSRDKDTGAAACAADIHPRRVIEAMSDLMPAVEQAAE